MNAENNKTWYGDIPNSWQISRLQKFLIEMKVSNNPIITNNVLSLTNKDGVIPYEEKGDHGNKSKEDFSEYKVAYPNTIVANSMNILIGSVGICNYTGCVSPVYYIFKSKNERELKFINYVMQTTQFQKELRKYANGILEIRLRVSSSDILKRLIPHPSTEEMEKISKFLDKQTENIEKIIKNEEKQIECLTEYKKNIITELVTKGINEEEMIESNIDWLPEIPAKWKTYRLKNIFKNFTEKNHGNAAVLSCYRELGVIPKDSRDDNHNVTSLDTNSYKFIEKNDLVINKMKAWSGSLAISNYEGIVSPAYYTCKVNYDLVNKDYIHYYARNRKIVSVYKMLSAGLRIGQWDLAIEDFLGLKIAIPSLEEQDAIVKMIEKKTSSIDLLIAKKQEKIEKMAMLEKSLIFDCVTGKRKVL